MAQVTVTAELPVPLVRGPIEDVPCVYSATVGAVMVRVDLGLYGIMLDLV